MQSRPAVRLDLPRASSGTAQNPQALDRTEPSGIPIDRDHLFRLPIEPGESNGLRSPSRLMVDKIATVVKDKVGERIGRLDDDDMVRLNRAILVFLGLA